MSKEPRQLLHEIQDMEGNERIYLRLENDRKLPLPYHFRPEEFILPGNVYEHPGGKVFALYDETTRSGLIYDGTCTLSDGPYWQMFQPVLRDNFFEGLVPSAIQKGEEQAIRAAGS